MLGPAADELAEMWRDQVRVYRYGRQVKLLEKVEEIAKEAGFTPQAVPPKILFPLLEGASFEDDESLHDMWAALLANAASPDNVGKVRPGFIATLKQMAPDEAAVLKWMFENEQELTFYKSGLWKAQVELGYLTKEESERKDQMADDMVICLDGLQAQELIRKSYFEPSDNPPLQQLYEARHGAAAALQHRIIQER